MRTMMIVLGATLLVGVGARGQDAEHPKPAPRKPEVVKAQKPVAVAPAHASIGYAAPLPPPPQSRTYVQPVYVQPVYVAPPSAQGSAGYVHADAPFVAQSDGSIVADFGSYQRTFPACSAQLAASANVNGRDALGRILPPIGIATLNAGTRGQVYGQLPSQNTRACYRMNLSGRAELMSY